MSHIEGRENMSDFIQQVDKEAETEFNEEKRAAEEAEVTKASERERRKTIRKSAEKAQGIADAKKDTMDHTHNMLKDRTAKARKAAKDVGAKNETVKASQEASAEAAAGVENASYLIEQATRALTRTEEQLDAHEADGRDPGAALQQKARDEREAIRRAKADAEEKKSQLQQALQRELEAKAALQEAERKLSMEKAEQKPLDERFRLTVAEYEAARDHASIRNSLASSTRDLESAEAKAEADRKAAAEKQLRVEHEARQRAAAEKAEREANETAEREKEDVWASFKAAERAAEKAAQEAKEEAERNKRWAREEAKEEAEKQAREDIEEKLKEEAEKEEAKRQATRQAKAKAEAEKQAKASAQENVEKRAKGAEEAQEDASSLPAVPTQDLPPASMEDLPVVPTEDSTANVAENATVVPADRSAENSTDSLNSTKVPAEKPAELAEATAQMLEEDEGRLPADPGCYMKMPTGCQSHVGAATRWRRDRWAEDRGLGASGCARRKDIWDHYCERTDVEMGYVAAQASPEASQNSWENPEENHSFEPSSENPEASSNPVSALQFGESPAWPWPWSKKPAMDKANARAYGEAETIDVYPLEPGCYMRMVSGCPKNPMKTDLWRRDSWAERQGLDQAGCEARKRVWDTYCATEDAKVVFVKSKASSEAVSALQLGESPAWPWPWSKQPAKGKAKAGAQSKAEAFGAYPSEPGCYMKMASGCPKNPMKTDLWRHDSWAERRGLDEAGCKLRKRVWDKYCASEDATIFFISSEASLQ